MKAKFNRQLFSTEEAAIYLGCASATVKHHVYIAKDLKPDDMIAGRLVFSQNTLDDFKANRRPGGRPPSDVNAAIAQAKACGNSDKADRLAGRKKFEKRLAAKLPKGA